MDLKQTLRELCLIPALSGHEQKLAAYLKKRFEACGLRVREDALDYRGVAIFGDRKKIARLTGSLPLLR